MRRASEMGRAVVRWFILVMQLDPIALLALVGASAIVLYPTTSKAPISKPFEFASTTFNYVSWARYVCKLS